MARRDVGLIGSLMLIVSKTESGFASRSKFCKISEEEIVLKSYFPKRTCSEMKTIKI